MLSQPFLPGEAADCSILSKCRCKALGFSKMQGLKSLTLCWRWFLGWVNDCVMCLFRYNAEQYIHSYGMWQCSPLIVECVRAKIVDALLTLTLITSKQPSYTEYLDPMNSILIIDIQFCVSKYYHLHPGTLWPLNFWLTTFHIIWVRDNMALSQSCAFGRQFNACRSFH